MEAEVDLMDYFSLSLKSKKRLTRWIGKRYRDLSISELVRNSKDERQLFKMCRYIDKWYDQHEPSMKPLEVHDSTEDTEASQEATGDTDEDSGEEPPEAAPEVKPEAPAFEQKVLSTKVKGRLNEFVLHHPEVCISEIIRNTDDEAEILRTIEEIESRVVPVDIRVKLWTCTRL